MITITQQRDKCIGCNYCVEAAPGRWRMSKRDGRSVLIDGKNRRGFWTVKVGNEEGAANEKAAALCPVKIIKLKDL
ncbi:MAG: ferredoxin [Chitinophagales bacterium]|nr:ferredoxin [Chitinophagales bacterium]